MQSRETRFVLRIESGERQGEQVPLTDGTLQVGRRPECGLVLADGSVSGKHAELRVAGERVEVVDLGSTNGTRVGGQKIAQAVVSHGDSLLFGNVRASLHDAELAGAPPAAPAPAAAAEPAPALGHVSAEKVTRSRSASRLPLLLLALLVVLGGGAFAYLRFLRPGGPTRGPAVIPSVAGNLLADASFEEGVAEWSADENAPLAFGRERAFARSGDVGLGLALEADDAWALARSPEVPLRARRSLAAAAALRVEQAAEGRLGVELWAADDSAPRFFAWIPAQRAAADFAELELAFDVPGGYDRGRLVVLARGRGAVALDDVSLVEREPLGRTATYTEYELAVLGQPGSSAVFLRSGRPVLAGFDLSSLGKAGPQGWSQARLEARAGPRGFELAFSGAPADASLHFTAMRQDYTSSEEAAWVASTGPGGYSATGGAFTRAGVTSLLLGRGTELLRLGFARPVEVIAGEIPGGMAFRIALGGLEGCELQLSFVEERAAAATLIDRALEAERKGDLGGALALWSELLDRYPFERRQVQQASEARARLIQSGLGEVEELRREMERARFFLLPELFQQGLERARALSSQYRGSEVEEAARAVVTLCEMALTELTAGRRSGRTQRLESVWKALDPATAPKLAAHVRAALEGAPGGGPVDPTKQDD
ncbi:MAG TPA: FHA domain-containing protein [Planctomycetota bacterium]